MRPRDVRRRDESDLKSEVIRLREEIFQHRFRGQSEEKVDRGLVRRNRRAIARIHTILREHALGVNHDLTAQARKAAGGDTSSGAKAGAKASRKKGGE